MNPTTWQQLTNRDTLLAVGVTLIMAGIILRGFASNARRELARRKQHLLDDPNSSGTDLDRQLAKPPGWIERNLGLIANGVLAAGVVIATAGFLRS